MSKLLHSYRFINQPYNHTINITLAEQQFKAAITYKTSIDYYLMSLFPWHVLAAPGTMSSSTHGKTCSKKMLRLQYCDAFGNLEFRVCHFCHFDPYPLLFLSFTSSLYDYVTTYTRTKT